MNKVFIFSFFLVLVFNTSYGQSNIKNNFDQLLWDKLDNLYNSNPTTLPTITDSIIQQASVEQDSGKLAIARYFKGRCLLKQNSFDTAIQLMQPAYEYASLQPPKFPDLVLGRITNDLAACYFRLGDALKCKFFFDKSIVYRSENEVELAESYYGIGNLYSALGDFSKSLDVQQKAMKIYTSHPEARSNRLDKIAACNANIGSILVEYEDTQADQYLDSALNNIDGLPLNKQAALRASIWFSKGSYHYKVSHNYQKSIDCYKEAIKYWKSLYDNSEALEPIAGSYSWIALCYANLKQPAIAISTIQKAIELGKQSGANQFDMSAYYRDAAGIFIADNKLDIAAMYADTASQLLSGDLENENPFSFRTSKFEVLSTLALINFKKLEIAKDKKYFQMAIDKANEAEEIFSEVHKSKFEDDAGIMKLTNDAYDALEAILNIYYNADSLKNAGYAEKSFDMVERFKSFVLLRNILKIKVDSSKDMPKTYSLVEVQNRGGILSESETLLEYFVGKEHIYCFVVQSDKMNFIRIKLDFSIDTFQSQLLHGITGYHGLDYIVEGQTNPMKTKNKQRECDAQYLKYASALYDKLLKPVEHLLNNKPNLIIVTDGVLGSIPFEALLTESNTEKNYAKMPYLIRKYSVRYAWSASSLFEMSKPKPTDTCSGAPFFTGFFPFSDRSYLSDKSHSPMKKLNFYFASDTIAKAFGQNNDNGIYMASNANLNDFLTNAPCAKYIFLGTHAQADVNTLNKNFIAFAPENKDMPNAYFLDLKTLQNNVKLHRAENVMLFACQTGVGASKKGEGIISMGWAFASIGARSVGYSLWSINDKPVQLLCDNFYKELGLKANKAEALRNAKLFLINTPPKKDMDHPYAWSGIVIAGSK
jgi:CHAT domain-containing protein